MTRLGRFDIRGVASEKISAYLTRPRSETDKFQLVQTLGIIKVPVDYLSECYLDWFRYKYSGSKTFDEFVTDNNFNNPLHIFTSCEMYRVLAFGQINKGRTTSADRVSFLKEMQSVLPGSRGLAMTLDQNFANFPGRFLRYHSFGDEDDLLVDSLVHKRQFDVGVTDVNYVHNDFSSFLGFFRVD